MARAKGAFTLVEMLVALLISGILLAVTAQLLFSAEQASEAHTERRLLEAQLSAGMAAISEDVLLAEAIDASSLVSDQLTVRRHVPVWEKGKLGENTLIVTYSLKDNEYPVATDHPPGKGALARQVAISGHSNAARNPVAIFVDKSSGLQVVYLDRQGNQAKQAEEVARVRVRLSGPLRSGETVQLEEEMALSARNWYLGGSA